MSVRRSPRPIAAVQITLLGISGIGLFGSLVPALFAVAVPEEFVWSMWLWWIVLPFVIIALIALTALTSRQGRPGTALAFGVAAALPGIATIIILIWFALS